MSESNCDISTHMRHKLVTKSTAKFNVLWCIFNIHTSIIIIL